MENMVERVAKAMAAADYADGFNEPYTPYEIMARAAIEAMREPTRYMLNEGANQDMGAVSNHTFVGPCAALASWHAMIDHALAKPAA